jgi:hypothetical protein
MAHAAQEIEIRCDLCPAGGAFSWREEATSDVCWLTVEAGLDALAEHLTDVHGADRGKPSLESDPRPGVPSPIAVDSQRVGVLTLN